MMAYDDDTNAARKTGRLAHDRRYDTARRHRIVGGSDTQNPFSEGRIHAQSSF